MACAGPGFTVISFVFRPGMGLFVPGVFWVREGRLVPAAVRLVRFGCKTFGSSAAIFIRSQYAVAGGGLKEVVIDSIGNRGENRR